MHMMQKLLHGEEIAKASDKVRKGKGVMMTAETAEEGVEYIMDKLLTKHVI